MKIYLTFEAELEATKWLFFPFNHFRHCVILFFFSVIFAILCEIQMAQIFLFFFLFLLCKSFVITDPLLSGGIIF